MKTSFSFLAIALGACMAPDGYAQATGTFTATGSMTTARSGHTATVLADGRVLIAGGKNSQDASCDVSYCALSSAEIYDPSTGTSTPTGDMLMARWHHWAALLPDGRVLVAGGNNGKATTAELYDPSKGTFTAAAGSAPINGVPAVLGNGKVLIAGTSPELYDPVTDTVSPTGPYSGPLSDGPLFYVETATLLQDGRVLVAGDADNDGAWLEHEEVYDPGSGTFKMAGGKPHTFDAENPSVIWDGYTATLLTNGKVLLAGGANEDFGYSRGAELYDPVADTLTVTGSMTLARSGHMATLIPDPNGRVLVVGGAWGVSLIDSEVYLPDTGTFYWNGYMTAARDLPSAALLFNGRVLISGGVGDNNNWLSSAELYADWVPPPAPGLFSLNLGDNGQGAIWNADTGKVASSATPATAGDVLSMYTTGLFEGSIVAPQVAVGGLTAAVLFFGNAPGFPGYYQVNFRLPNGLMPGSSTPVQLTYLGLSSNTVTIAVQ